MLVRWLIVIAFFVITFVPPWGLAYLAWQYLFTFPILVVGLALAWIMPAAFFLPIPIGWFRISTSFALAGMFSIGTWSILDLVGDPLTLVNQWWGPLLTVLAGIVVGWLMVSTRMYREAKGTVITEESGEEHAH
jgi:hypothetical protein